MTMFEHGVTVGSKGRGPLAIGRRVACTASASTRFARSVRKRGNFVQHTPRLWFAKLAALGALLGLAVALLVI